MGEIIYLNKEEFDKLLAENSSEYTYYLDSGVSMKGDTQLNMDEDVCGVIILKGIKYVCKRLDK